MPNSQEPVRTWRAGLTFADFTAPKFVKLELPFLRKVLALL